MKGGIIGKDPDNASEFFHRIDGEGSVNDVFGNADVFADLVVHVLTKTGSTVQRSGFRVGEFSILPIDIFQPLNAEP
jgi:hypothetical protein